MIMTKDDFSYAMYAPLRKCMAHGRSDADLCRGRNLATFSFARISFLWRMYEAETLTQGLCMAASHLLVLPTPISAVLSPFVYSKQLTRPRQCPSHDLLSSIQNAHCHPIKPSIRPIASSKLPQSPYSSECTRASFLCCELYFLLSRSWGYLHSGRMATHDSNVPSYSTRMW
jgi:hypothetical protein